MLKKNSSAKCILFIKKLMVRVNDPQQLHSATSYRCFNRKVICFSIFTLIVKSEVHYFLFQENVFRWKPKKLWKEFEPIVKRRSVVPLLAPAPRILKQEKSGVGASLLVQATTNILFFVYLLSY